jgi:hypothetical protein
MPEVKRFLGFSGMEWAIIALGIGGLFALRLCFPATWWKMFFAGLGLSFLFEAAMEPLFTYHPQLRERHCIRNSDVNFIFPLGWMSIAGWTAVVAEKLLPLPLFPAYIIAGFVVGNAHEYLFYHRKFWMYNYHEAMIGNFKPLLPVFPVCGVPIQVIFGYCNVGIMIFFLAHVLF